MVQFAKEYPERFFDVAIAEQHAVTLAAGMACEGLKPVVAIYSTFSATKRGFAAPRSLIRVSTQPLTVKKSTSAPYAPRETIFGSSAVPSGRLKNSVK